MAKCPRATFYDDPRATFYDEHICPLGICAGEHLSCEQLSCTPERWTGNLALTCTKIIAWSQQSRAGLGACCSHEDETRTEGSAQKSTRKNREKPPLIQSL